eukprot:maker-scaffold_2-snap-gene-0.3-mRNA-1 protein AED:0.00 eAED:0.00 QI:98/1/1/1/1/1/4/50/354
MDFRKLFFHSSGEKVNQMKVNSVPMKGFEEDETKHEIIEPILKEEYKVSRLRRTRSCLEQSENKENSPVNLNRHKSFDTCFESGEKYFSKLVFNSCEKKIKKQRTNKNCFEFKPTFLETMDFEDHYNKNLIKRSSSKSQQSSKSSFSQDSSETLTKFLDFTPVISKVQKNLCFFTPTKEEQNNILLKNDCSKYFDKIKSIGIKILAIDFDETLLSIHTKSEWKYSAKSLSQYIRPFFNSFLKEASKQKFKTIIVTFSEQKALIKRVCNLCFDGNVEIFCGSDGINNWKNGKNNHLKKVLKKFNVENSEILFVDNDKRNVENAKAEFENMKVIEFKNYLGDISAEKSFCETLLNL